MSRDRTDERRPCPWCSWSTPIIDCRLMQHGLRFNREVSCPVAGMTLADAQDKTDQAVAHHAATGD